MRKAVDPHCRAFQSAIALLGRPWNGLILGLLQGGALRFGELEEQALGIGPKTLSARLKALERRGLVVRTIDAGPPVRVSYSLTAKGLAFEKVTEAIEQWGRDLLAGELPPAVETEQARPRRRRAASR